MSLLLNLLMGLFTGPLGKITEEISNAYKAKLNAQNDSERIAADERIATLEATKATILASQASPVERWVRVGFAFPFVIYINKLVLWDKVLGWGMTDGLSPALSQIMMMVLGGYFVDGIVRRVIKR